MNRKLIIPVIYRLLAFILLASLGLSIVQVRRSASFRPAGLVLSAPATATPLFKGPITTESPPAGAPGSSQGAATPSGASNTGALDAVPQQSGSGPQVIVASGPSLSQPLSSMVLSEPLQAGPPEEETNEQNRILPPKFQNPVRDFTFDRSIVQSASGSLAPMPSPSANFEGVNSNGNYPPDTNGDIGFDSGSGKKYYVQWVNVRFEIWDVTNPASPSSVLGPSYLTTIWSGMGTLCSTNNGGDPIVLFDHLANRWFVSQLAYDFGSSSYPYGPYDFHQCVAVSTSANPTGTWNRYDYLWDSGSSAVFNDYPKFAVWPDGYYMSVNEYDESTSGTEPPHGAAVAALDRAAMLLGHTATMQVFDLGPVNSFYGNILPSDLDGPAPASGTPNYFTEWDDSSWNPDPADELRIWQFHVDWTTPANSTFGTSNSTFNPNQMVSTSNVDPNMCNYHRNCIPQPDTPVTVDAISDRLMHRMQYRILGSTPTLVGNHTVDAGGDRAGVHWFELQQSGTSWAIQQQGLYAPADGNSRWMGSVALDQNGDMALGYSVSSSTTYPSIRYAGRLVGDTLGSLPQSEVSLVAGSGSQTGTAYRWGDYSMMGVDPQDGCTFWYTNEYYVTTGATTWHTQIGSFAFPSCVLKWTISGNAGVGNATITYTGGVTSANGAGVYSFMVPDNWIGDVTPSKFGYTFTPDHIHYSGVTSNQSNQNYIATTAPAPTIARLYPPDGSTACPKPGVGVDLNLTDWVRSAGSFDPSGVSLTLDGANVTASAVISQNLTSPASIGRVIYTPTSNLSQTIHTAVFTFPSGPGPVTTTWHFTVAKISCP